MKEIGEDIEKLRKSHKIEKINIFFKLPQFLRNFSCGFKFKILVNYMDGALMQLDSLVFTLGDKVKDKEQDRSNDEVIMLV